MVKTNKGKGFYFGEVVVILNSRLISGNKLQKSEKEVTLYKTVYFRF